MRALLASTEDAGSEEHMFVFGYPVWMKVISLGDTQNILDVEQIVAYRAEPEHRYRSRILQHNPHSSSLRLGNLR